MKKNLIQTGFFNKILRNSFQLLIHVFFVRVARKQKTRCCLLFRPTYVDSKNRKHSSVVDSSLIRVIVFKV